MEQKKMREELEDFIEASGLLEYDYASIERIYRGSPMRLINRLLETLVPIGLFIIGIGIDKILGLLNNEERTKERAKECAQLFVSLGPAFIKAGQALSTRPDIIPTVLLDELAQLQDQLPGFDSKLAMACIEEDLKKPIEEIFKEIEINPISAASLGQVHKGILLNGESVAVKVQRPGLREQITLDLYIVRNIAVWINKNVKLVRSDVVGLIDELGKRVFEEMDYLNEADNARKFRELHSKNEKICIPKIYKDETSRRVLTMEWIEGVKLTNINAVKKLGIDPNEMIEIGVNCSLQQLLEHGFFHADPHPGNLLALNDGRICYLDFGMMSEITRESRTGLIQAVVHLVNKNFKKLSQDFVTLGFLSKEVNLEPIVPAFESVFDEAIEKGVAKLDFKAVTDEMSGVMYKFPFRVPPYYALIIRSLITLEGIALSVDPEFKILGAAYPYFAKRLIEDPDPSLRKSLKDMVYDHGKFNWKRLEELIEITNSQVSIDIELILDQLINLLFSEKGGLLRDQLVDNMVIKLDDVSWRIVRKAKRFLLSPIEVIKKRKEWNIKNRILLELEPIRELRAVLKTIPGFRTQLLLARIPRILSEPDTRKMSIGIMKGLTEKGLVRVIKRTAKTSS